MNEIDHDLKEQNKTSCERKTCVCTEEYNERVCADKREELLRKAEKETEKCSYAEADLQEVYKNAFTGKESVEILRSFSANKGFRTILIRQYKEYASLAKEIELCANQLGFELKKTSFFARSMMYITTAMNTINDKSDSKLSEIYIQGINMGIIAMVRLINKLSEENKSLSYANALLSLLQKDLEEMKLFL